MTPTAITSIVSVLFGGGGLAVIVNALTGQRKVKTDAAARLSDEALRWVNEFQEEAKLARADAAALRKETTRTREESARAREEAREARVQVAAVTGQAEALGRQVQALRAAILDPQVTREQLHSMVQQETPEGR